MWRGEKREGGETSAGREERLRRQPRDGGRGEGGASREDGGERGGVRETGGGRSARSEETVDARAELGAGPSRGSCWETAEEGSWHLGGGGMW